MARVQIASEGWGVVQDALGNAQASLTATITTASGSAATVYSAATGTTTTTPTTDSSGRIAGYLEEGTYTVTISGSSQTVEVVSGRTGGVYNVRSYGATGDGSTDDKTAIQAAINAANTAGGGTVVFPFTSTGYKHTGLTTYSNITLLGVGNYVTLTYSGSGNGIALVGTSGAHKSYAIFENLLLTASTRHQGVGIQISYTDVVALRNVRVNQFATGINADNTTDLKIYNGRTFDNTTGLQLGDSCGGTDWFGGQWDSNQLALSITGTGFNGALFEGITVDTDAYSLNGAASQGAVVINAGVGRATFNNCRFFAQAAPVAGTGATVLVDGTAAGTMFLNCHFDGGALSQAAIKVNNATYVRVIGGRTFNHATSSYIVTSSAANVLFLDPSFAETTFLTGTGTTVPRVIGSAPSSLPSVASAATITLSSTSDVVTVSGTTTITSVTASWPGRRVTLIFSGILTFTDGSNLKLAGNFVTSADDTITLVSDGTNWVETARAVN